MAFDAKVIEIMVASPGGLDAERQIVREVVASWNAIHARDKRIVLRATGWESDAAPELSGLPQQLINERVLAHADIVVGLLWTRIGTPTGAAESGTIEEIRRHHEAGRPVMLYFSDKPIQPGYDSEQYAALKTFQAWAQGQGLVGRFASNEELHRKLTHDLQLVLRDNPYLRGLTGIDLIRVSKTALEGPPQDALSPEAQQLLLAAADSDNGLVMTRRTLTDAFVSVGGKNFAQGADRRTVARWLAAAEEIYDRGLARDINGKREIFEVNDAGYTRADAVRVAREG